MPNIVSPPINKSYALNDSMIASHRKRAACATGATVALVVAGVLLCLASHGMLFGHTNAISQLAHAHRAGFLMLGGSALAAAAVSRVIWHAGRKKLQGKATHTDKNTRVKTEGHYSISAYRNLRGKIRIVQIVSLGKKTTRKGQKEEEAHSLRATTQRISFPVNKSDSISEVTLHTPD